MKNEQVKHMVDGHSNRLIRSDPSVDLKHTLHLSPQNHDTVGLVETDVEGVPSCPEPRRKRFIFGAWVIMSPPQL